MNKSRRILTKILSISIFTLLLVCLSIQIDSINSPNKSYAVGVDTSWYTDLSELNSNQPNLVNAVAYYRMSSFYNKNANGIYTSALNPNTIINSSTEFIILIETAADFQAFTELCNSEYRTNYLSYDYKLGNNIDFTESARYDGFVVPIGWGSTEADGFTGTFDGNGFTISNLYYEPISSVNIEKYQDADGEVNIEYYSLFSQVSRNGRVCNLGLINPVILQGSIFRPMMFVSPLVGINYGTVENVFVQDLRSDGGLTADGGFDISGLMTINVGTFKNAYVAYQTIISSSVNIVSSISPILNYNQILIEGSYQYGTIENLYYNEELDTVHANNFLNSYNRNNNVIQISESLATTEFSTVFATTSYDSIWYDNKSYSFNIGLTYPILQGIRLKNNYYELWDAIDVITMSQLTFNYPTFSTYRYKLMNNIDMTEVSSEAFYQSNTSFKGELTSDVVTDNNKKVRFVNGYYSDYYTIANIDLTKGYSFNKYHSYGFFPFLEGRIYNVNFYNINVSVEDALVADEITTVGLITGKVEKNARIENVNVFGNIKNTQTLSNDGKFYFGGITGHNRGSLIACTTAGSINPGTISANAGIAESAIGGIAGYLAGGNIQNTVNGMEINGLSFTTSTTVAQYVGGIIGAGETNEFYKNVNKGNINVGSNTNPYTGIPYIGGVIGQHQATNNSIYELFNQGDINYYLNALNTVYLAGILNSVSPTTKMIYEALNNAGTININKNVTITSLSQATNLNIYLAGVLFLFDAEADILGIANLNYKYTNNYNETADGTYKYTKVDLTAPQTIDLAIIDEYAPCLRTENTKTVNLENSYNYRDINFITTQIVYFNNLSLSGNTTGLNINYNGIRNEGNLTTNFTYNAPNTLEISSGVYKLLKVYGCFEELSDGYFAKNLYNGGKIEVEVQTGLTVRFCIYLAGICYKNGNTSYIINNGTAKFNPENETYDPTLKGTIDNAINNGEIYLHYDGNMGGIHGVTRVAGIVCYNASLITSCFNTGNIWNQNYIPAAAGAYGSEAYETESSGIVFINIGQYAQVRDCANSGDIVSINTSNESRTNVTTNYTWVNAAGIVVRNDKLESGADYSGRNQGHASQIISFSINYGNIYAYNADISNINSWGGDEGQCKAGGILGQGLCTVINVINYGNVYSTRISSGIYGQVFFSKFTTEMGSIDHISISNSINYGKIRGLIQGVVPNYNNSNDHFGANITTFVRSYDGATISARTNHVAGALIGNLYGNNSALLSRIQIRYLINFDELIDILGVSNSISNNISFATENMATIKTDDWSPSPFRNINSYTLDTTETGVFNINFPLRTPLTSDDPDYFITDRFIADYIQFIPFTKVNDRILENLNWTEMAYENAVNAFLNDLAAVAKVVDSKLATNNIDSVLNALRNSDAFQVLTADANKSINLLWELVDNSSAEETAELLDFFLAYADSAYYVNDNFKINLVDNIYKILIDTSDSSLVSTMFDKYFQSSYFNEFVNSMSSDDLAYFLEDILRNMNLTEAEIDNVFLEYYPTGLSNSEKIMSIIETAVDLKTLLNEIIDNPEVTNQEVEDTINNLASTEKNAIISTLVNSLTTDQITNLWGNLLNNNSLITSILNANLNGGYIYYLANSTSNRAQVDGIYGVTYSNNYNNATNKPINGGTFVYTGDYHYDEETRSYVQYSSNSSLRQISITYYTTTANSRYRITNTNPVTYGRSGSRYYAIADDSNSGVFSVRTGNRTYTFTGIYLETHMRNTTSGLISLANNNDYVPTSSDLIAWITTFLTNASTTDTNRNSIISILNDVLRYENYSAMIKGSSFSNEINTSLIDKLLTNNPSLIDDYFTIDQDTKILLIIKKVVETNQSFTLLNSFKEKIANVDKIELLWELLYSSPITATDYKYFVELGLFTSKELIELGISSDPNLIQNYLREHEFSYEEKRLIIEKLILNSNSTINKSLISNILNINIDNQSAFENLLRDAGLSHEDYLNYIGIYALSSSFGILNGNFIPDNINFSELDPVIGYDEKGEEITDSTWRGGFTEDGVADISDESKVHYKFHVVMKQLKKAIATNIFDIELISENGEYTIPVSEIDNTNKRLVFYVAENDTEINQTGYHINTNSGTFELSFGASFFNDGVKNEVLAAEGVLFTVEEAIGSMKTGSITVYAEDRTVATTYEVIVYKTSAKSVESLAAVYVNDSSYQSTVTTTGNNSTVQNAVNAANGSIRLEFDLSNVAYNISLAEHFVLTHEDGTIFDISSLLDNTVENNAIVSRPANVTDAVGPGSVVIDLNIESLMPGGVYTLTLNLNDEVSHNVIFTKTKYSDANVVSASYNNQNITITQNGIVNSATTSIPVGTPFTADDFLIIDGVPAYLSNLEISPLAVLSYYNGATVPYYEVSINDNRYQYRIVYTITSENGQTVRTFEHTLIEDAGNDIIENIFSDGVLIGSNHSDEYSYTFNYNTTPTIRFDKYLNNVHFDENYGTLSILNLTELLEQGVLVTINEEIGFEVRFNNDVAPGEYVFILVYESDIPLAINNQPSKFEFASITITKEANDNSLLENIRFITDTVIASVDTLITGNQVTMAEFKNHREQIEIIDSGIKCLLDGIYYNENDNFPKYYVIGLVSKTGLDQYKPTFTLPYGASIYRIVTIDNVTYRYITYSDSLNSGPDLIYLVSEDGTTIREVDAEKTYPLATIPTGYVISSLSGTAGDAALEEDYNSTLSSDGVEELTYVNYRVYAEGYSYSDSTRSKYYTDYTIAVNDITNNIKFELEVVAENSAVRDAIKHVHVEINNYENVEESGISTQGGFINVMAMFAYQDLSSLTYLNEGDFSTNSSGWFIFEISVPKGYTYVYQADNGDECSPGTPYVPVASIVTRIVRLKITIKVDPTDNSWGVNNQFPLK